MQIHGLDHEQKQLGYAVAANLPVLLVGPTGCGKTTVVHELAKKEGKELVSIPLHGQIGREELLGKWLLKDGKTYWQDGILTEAIRKDQWVLFDEINAALPEVLFLLHSLLDHQKKINMPEKDNEVLQAGKDFRFFATMNPTEDYTGTKVMNMAFMSRFGLVLHFDYMDYRTESKIIVEALSMNGGNISDDDARRISLLGGAVRELYKKKEIFYPCSTRDLVSAAWLLSLGATLMDAVNDAVVNKLTPEERAIVAGKTEVIVKYLNQEKQDFSIIEILKDADKLKAEHAKFKEAVKKFQAVKNGSEKALAEINF